MRLRPSQMVRDSGPMPESARHFVRRRLWTMLGAVALGLGVVGILVPLLPTTPFLILAAYLFSRGSRRLHAWLVNHRLLGPPIRNWRRHRAVSTRAKLSALIAMLLIFVFSYAVAVPRWALAIQGVILAGVAIFLVSRPTPPSATGGEER